MFSAANDRESGAGETCYCGFEFADDDDDMVDTLEHGGLPSAAIGTREDIELLELRAYQQAPRGGCWTRQEIAKIESRAAAQITANFCKKGLFAGVPMRMFHVKHF